MADKQIILITGGNSGIGFALAGLLLADKSKHVIITSRSIEKGEAALKKLKAMEQPGTAEMIQLDVTKTDSIADAAWRVEKQHGRLDALVNNAAQAVAPDGTSLFDKMQMFFASNVSGPAAMVECFLPLLKKSVTTARIINHSSGAGSIGIRLSEQGKRMPFPIPYASSKSALNMLSACQAVEYENEKLKIFTYCPGFTESNLSEYNRVANGAKPTVEGARPMIPILNGEKDAEHACFLNSEGGQHPW